MYVAKWLVCDSKMALFGVFFPLCAIIHPYTYRASFSDAARENCCVVYCFLLLFGFRYLIIGFRYSAVNFCFSSSSWFCYVVYPCPDVSFLCFERLCNQRCNVYQRAYGVIFSKGKCCCSGFWCFLLYTKNCTKNCTKTNVLVQHRFTFEAISCLLPIRGRWVCSPCRGCWWFAHRDRPWGVYGVWWCKRP